MIVLKKKNKGAGRWFALFLASVLLIGKQAYGFDNAATSNDSGPPKLPPVFNRATVERLIERIDEGQNATILKVGYFTRQGKHRLSGREGEKNSGKTPSHDAASSSTNDSLPLAEGLSILRQAAISEPRNPRTKRWLMLQSVYGFASVRSEGSAVDEGITTYKNLFTQLQAHRLKESGDIEYARRTVNDYVAMVPKLLSHSTSGVIVRETLEQASSLTLSDLRNGVRVSSYTPWDTAMRGGVSKRQVALLETALADPAVPKGFAFCWLAASIYESESPIKSTAFLFKAERALAQHAEDPVWVSRLYDTLRDRLVANGELDKAITVQKRGISRLGVGRADLIKLYLQKKDQTDFMSSMAALRTSKDVPEQDFIDVAEALIDRSEERAQRNSAEGKSLREQGKELLAHYLNGVGQRNNTEANLYARFLLARSYVEDGQKSQAVATLKEGMAHSIPTTPRGRLLFSTLQRQLETLPE